MHTIVFPTLPPRTRSHRTLTHSKKKCKKNVARKKMIRNSTLWITIANMSLIQRTLSGELANIGMWGDSDCVSPSNRMHVNQCYFSFLLCIPLNAGSAMSFLHIRWGVTAASARSVCPIRREGVHVHLPNRLPEISHLFIQMCVQKIKEKKETNDRKTRSTVHTWNRFRIMQSTVYDRQPKCCAFDMTIF